MNEEKRKRQQVQKRKLSDAEKLDEILEMVKENREGIDTIRRYMRRMFVSKLIYWLIIIVITAGAVYAARPYARKAIETYRSVRKTLEKTSDMVEQPARMFQDVRLLKKLFELNSE